MTKFTRFFQLLISLNLGIFFLACGGVTLPNEPPKEEELLAFKSCQQNIDCKSVWSGQCSCGHVSINAEMVDAYYDSFDCGNVLTSCAAPVYGNDTPDSVCTEGLCELDLTPYL